MLHKIPWKTAFVLASLILILVVSACSPAAAPVLPSATAALPATSAPEATATQPPLPTATATQTTAPTAPTLTSTPLPPTETPLPSTTPTIDPAALKPGISAWCLPAEVLVSAASDPLKPPERANMGVMENGALEIKNMPFSVCVFLYTFTQAAPEGLKLEVYEMNQKTPWLKADLKPVEGKADTVYTHLRHSYIIDPPLWNIGYEFVVRDAAGAEIQRDTVNLHRWATGMCWQGTYPDPVTLYCPLQQDLHPWDPGYGKKLPTVTPRP